MSCPSCNDRGVFRVCYHDDSPTEFAVCLCEAGTPFRLTENQGKAHAPAYAIWAIRHGIDPAQVAPMEVLLTDEELAARGFGEVSPASAVDAIAAAARKRGQRK